MARFGYAKVGGGAAGISLIKQENVAEGHWEAQKRSESKNVRVDG